METVRTKRQAGILVFLVFLLGLLVGGVGNHLWGARVWGGNPPPRRTPMSPGGFLADMTQKLQLTPDQQKQLEAILDNTRAQMQANDQKRNEIRMATRAQIRALLTPEQQTKFDEMGPRGRGDRGQGGPGSGFGRGPEGTKPDQHGGPPH